MTCLCAFFRWQVRVEKLEHQIQMAAEIRVQRIIEDRDRLLSELKTWWGEEEVRTVELRQKCTEVLITGPKNVEETASLKVSSGRRKTRTRAFRFKIQLAAGASLRHRRKLSYKLALNVDLELDSKIFTPPNTKLNYFLLGMKC